MLSQVEVDEDSPLGVLAFQGTAGDACGILIANPQPGLLKRVVGLAHRPEHPVGDRAEVGPVLLERLVHRQL